jgi:putative membrane-bound dehydrogenase-like protein
MNFSPVLAFSCAATIFSAEIPQLADERFKLELVAEHPQIVTPTGMAVDARGRLFVIESHTHQPKPDYPGPKTDIVKIFEDKDGSGSLETISIFGEGYRAAMNLAFEPGGDLFLAHRDGVLRLPDKNNDGKADGAEAIVTLETKEKFPHNGLGGVVFGADGWLYLGFGENLGRAYTVTGSDGSAIKGGGEGGNIFRCRADGSKLERYATGFWNPFSLSFDSAGNLFAVDNDPDGRPPCRLLHVIKHGDYGYQFRYGRSGLHPFVAWDGEIPGTLPMVAGTGEAPSGILWLAKENRFLVTSWGDNTLETYPLRRVETTFKSEKQILARGDSSFRPVALAAAADGAIYISDWADKEYPVHQKGRIWRLRGGGPASAMYF